jgi:Protein of unknown function (DUF2442)
VPTISQFFGIVIQMFWANMHRRISTRFMANTRPRGPDRYSGPRNNRWKSAQTGSGTDNQVGGRASQRIDGGLGIMPSQATAKENTAPGIIPAAPWRVQAITVLPGYRLSVTFRDGTSGIVDMSAVRADASCGLFASLASPDIFEKARIELGIVTWPNGTDLDPLWMYEEIKDKKTWSVPF